MNERRPTFYPWVVVLIASSVVIIVTGGTVSLWVGIVGIVAAVALSAWVYWWEHS